MVGDTDTAFVLLDGYARRKHKCFLAEMNLTRNGQDYRLCFRPTGVDVKSPHQYICKYLTLDARRVEAMGLAARLTDEVARALDDALSPLAALS